MIIPLAAEHWPEVRRIYLEGIATRQATFEQEAPSWEKWDASHHLFGRVVAREAEQIQGWAALAPVSTRSVYSGVAEISVYIGAVARGQGLGRLLLEHVIAESEINGIWTLQAGIFPENIASLTLHQRCGFREVGVRERIGKMDDTWRNTVLLERRSKVVGID